MLALAVFSFTLGWLPSGGANSVGASWDSEWQRIFSLDFLQHLALPALTLAVYLQGAVIVDQRNIESVAEQIEEVAADDGGYGDCKK